LPEAILNGTYRSPITCDGEGHPPRGTLDRRDNDTSQLAEEPMTLTVHLPDSLGQRLRERASRDGRAVEEYVLGLIERDAAGPGSGRGVDDSSPRPGQAPALSDGEFEHLLDALASGPGLPHLPPDFSRGDIYADHD
jgi:hypothetical protein